MDFFGGGEKEAVIAIPPYLEIKPSNEPQAEYCCYVAIFLQNSSLPGKSCVCLSVMALLKRDNLLENITFSSPSIPTLKQNNTAQKSFYLIYDIHNYDTVCFHSMHIHA